MEVEKKLRVACYSRVSEIEQKHGVFSLTAQLESLKDFVEKNDEYILIDFYSDVGGSGKIEEREELQRLLQDVRDNRIDLILFTYTDRWARTVKQYSKLQETLDDYNVAWRATNENYEIQTKAGRLKVDLEILKVKKES